MKYVVSVVRSQSFSRGFSPSLFVLVILCLLQFAVPARATSSVTLAWNPSGTTNVAGYKIYYGTTSHNYSAVVSAGNTTNATLTGLVPGATYYFSATTVDGAGNQSDYATEASYTVPLVAASLGSAAQANGQFSFAVGGATGATYVVEASSDLLNWTALQTNTAPFLFVDPAATQYPSRFYRAVAVTP